MSSLELPHAKKVVVVGAGGNIGSHLVPHLGRIPGVGSILLVDRDTYEPKNLAGQDAGRSDIGRAKAKVQARKLRGINPELEVTAVVDSVENLPLGRLRADVIVVCVDSRVSRQYLSRAAWRLRVVLIDAGVRAEGLLARVNVYLPGRNAPCMECAWSPVDYQAIEVKYPCPEHRPEAPATNAPSSLGALAAALEAVELEKVLGGQWDEALVGRQVLVSATHHKHWVTSFRRNRDCRFDHRTWRVRRLRQGPEEITPGDVLELGRKVGAGSGPVELYVEGKAFLGRLSCSGCGWTRKLPIRLSGRLRRSEETCRQCGGSLRPVGFDTADWLSLQYLDEKLLTRPLRYLGFRAGDVFALSGPDKEVHFELA